jgi:hypothetical protein
MRTPVAFRRIYRKPLSEWCHVSGITLTQLALVSSDVRGMQGIFAKHFS